MDDDPGCRVHGRSAEKSGYGSWPTVSKIGRARPLVRYAAPRRRYHRPGEWDGPRARAESLPRGELQVITFTPGRTACRVSQHWARRASYAAGAELVPLERNCGRQK